ncbi:MAG: hypothetical protein WAU78_11480 [Roseiarcus sp.]|jgi:hypothetical protein
MIARQAGEMDSAAAGGYGSARARSIVSAIPRASRSNLNSP